MDHRKLRREAIGQALAPYLRNALRECTWYDVPGGLAVPTLDVARMMGVSPGSGSAAAAAEELPVTRVRLPDRRQVRAIVFALPAYEALMDEPDETLPPLPRRFRLSSSPSHEARDEGRARDRRKEVEALFPLDSVQCWRHPVSRGRAKIYTVRVCQHEEIHADNGRSVRMLAAYYDALGRARARWLSPRAALAPLSGVVRRSPDDVFVDIQPPTLAEGLALRPGAQGED